MHSHIHCRMLPAIHSFKNTRILSTPVSFLSFTTTVVEPPPPGSSSLIGRLRLGRVASSNTGGAERKRLEPLAVMEGEERREEKRGSFSSWSMNCRREGRGRERRGGVGEGRGGDRRRWGRGCGLREQGSNVGKVRTCAVYALVAAGKHEIYGRVEHIVLSSTHASA